MRAFLLLSVCAVYGFVPSPISKNELINNYIGLENERKYGVFMFNSYLDGDFSPASSQGVKSELPPPAATPAPIPNMNGQPEQSYQSRYMDEETDDFDKTLEQIIADRIEEAASMKAASSYAGLREVLRDTTQNSQERLDLSISERTQTIEKIQQLEFLLEQQRKFLEDELSTKMNTMQSDIDQEVEAMVSALGAEINVESERGVALERLIKELQIFINKKEYEVAMERETTAEMEGIRSKVKPNRIASQMDSVVAQKREVLFIEEGVLSNLNICLKDCEDMLSASIQKKDRMTNVWKQFQTARPQVYEQYEWSNVESLQDFLVQASDNAVLYDERLMEVRDRINAALITRCKLIGDPVPPGLSSASSSRSSSPFGTLFNSASSSKNNDRREAWDLLKKPKELQQYLETSLARVSDAMTNSVSSMTNRGAAEAHRPVDEVRQPAQNFYQKTIDLGKKYGLLVPKKKKTRKSPMPMNDSFDQDEYYEEL